jgi:colanic acid biosynthesis glycosyl transferase WcaI
MKLLLLNQYGAASGAPTGRILAELGAGLEKVGHSITLLDVDASYGKSRRGARRILHELGAHAQLQLRSLAHGRVDAVLSLSSPALLAVTGGMIARLLGARHYHWAMDLYPEVGLQLGELKDGAMTRLYSRLMRRAYRGARRVVALDEDMRNHLRETYGVDAAVVEPFPPDVEWIAPPTKAPGESKRWMYSGNLGRAHEIDGLLRVQQKLEGRGVHGELVLQGQGAQFSSSQEAARALGLQRVLWRPPAPAETLGASLLEADVLVVTRKPEVKGLLLPSKLMLAELSGRPILWIGDTDGYTARRLAKGGHGVFSSEQTDEIAAWLEQTLAPGALPPVAPRPSSSLREQGVAQWQALLREK